MELYYKDLSPPARAAYATIKHLNLPVTLKDVNLFSGETRTEEYLKMNPAHQVPTLVDNGFVMSESRAIMGYLVNQYSPNHALYPADAKARGQIDRMLYFEGTNLYPALKAVYIPQFRHKKDPEPEAVEAAKSAIAELIALKGSNKFIASNQCSLADISLAMTYTFMEKFFAEEAKPLQQWYKDVEAAVPAVKEINDALDLTPIMEMMKK